MLNFKNSRADLEQVNIRRAERIWSNIGAVLIYSALLLQIWASLRDPDNSIPVSVLAVGWGCLWASERFGRKADALSVLAWAEEMDEKLAEAKNPWGLKS